MKETIKINLNGQLFDLDNDAYERLKNYLDSLKAKFSSSPKEAEEILEDIESRIAEILHQKISASKQVITLADIEEIISLMGTADEMEEPENETEEKTRSSAGQYNKSNKRFYRDPQNSILGGVSSGIAAYFNMDPLWIRLIFVLLTFASFSGVIIYAILWLILPPALTTAQRLEMQGKRVNISDIEDSVKNEFEKVKSSVKNISNSRNYKNAENAVSEIFGALGNIIVVFLKVIGAIIGISLIVALVVSVIGIIIGGAAFLPFEIFNNFHWPHMISWPNASLFGICLFLVIVIPIGALLGAIFRFLFNIKSSSRFAAGIGATIWVVALITLIVLVAVEGDRGHFRESKSTTYDLVVPDAKPLYIGLKSNNYDQDDLEHYQVFNYEFIYDDFHNDFLKSPSLVVEKTHDDEAKLVVERNYAHFRIGRVPRSIHRLVEYEWYMKDSLLLLNEFYSCDDDDAWRVPDVKLTLKIPEGRKVYFDDDLVQILEEDYTMERILEMKEGRLERVN